MEEDGDYFRGTGGTEIVVGDVEGERETVVSRKGVSGRVSGRGRCKSGQTTDSEDEVTLEELPLLDQTK